MKWKVPELGDKRSITKFCFFPCKAHAGSGGKSEIRWLEKVTVVQEYYIGFPFHKWWNLYFEDKTLDKMYEEIYNSCKDTSIKKNIKIDNTEELNKAIKEATKTMSEFGDKNRIDVVDNQ